MAEPPGDVYHDTHIFETRTGQQSGGTISVDNVEKYQPNRGGGSERQWRIAREIIDTLDDDGGTGHTPWDSVKDASNEELERLLNDSSAMREFCDVQVEALFDNERMYLCDFSLRDYENDGWVRDTVLNFFAERAIGAIARQAVDRLVDLAPDGGKTNSELEASPR